MRGRWWRSGAALAIATLAVSTSLASASSPGDAGSPAPADTTTLQGLVVQKGLDYLTLQVSPDRVQVCRPARGAGGQPDLAVVHQIRRTPVGERAHCVFDSVGDLLGVQPVGAAGRQGVSGEPVPAKPPGLPGVARGGVVFGEASQELIPARPPGQRGAQEYQPYPPSAKRGQAPISNGEIGASPDYPNVIYDAGNQVVAQMRQDTDVLQRFGQSLTGQSGRTIGRLFEKGVDWIAIQNFNAPDSPVVRFAVQEAAVGLGQVQDPYMLEAIREVRVGQDVAVLWVYADGLRVVHLAVPVAAEPMTPRELLSSCPGPFRLSCP